MGIAAMALALVVLASVAGYLEWSLLFHFEDYYPVAEVGFASARRVRVLCGTLAGLINAGVLAVLVLEFQQLVAS